MKVIVLQGGPSSEADVSRKSGAEVFKALKQKGFEAVQRELDEHIWEKLKQDKPDLVFLALHGRPGEDGSVQGMLELLGIPYTGSGVMASALGMDKEMTKLVFKQTGIPFPKGFILKKQPPEKLTTKGLIETIGKNCGLPCVVKPCSEGSTIGLSVVRKAKELPGALEVAFAADSKAIVEQYISGTEVTVGVIGNEEAEAFPVVEIISAKELYDYDAKYTQGLSEHIIPARLPARTQQRLRKLAVKAHQAIGCRGFSRTDFIVEGNRIYALEINTTPGLTALSLFPDAARAAGISFSDLVERIVCLALRTC